MANEKKWFESKTIWVNGLAFLASVLGIFGYADYLTPEVQTMLVGSIMSMVNIYLRFKTEKAIK